MRGYTLLLPHKEVSIIYIINSSLTFLCSLLCYKIYKERGAPRIFYVSLGLFFFLNSIFFLTNYIGPNGVIGNLFHAWIVYEYLMMFMDLFLTFSVTFLAVRISLRNTSDLKTALISFLISALAIILSYGKIVISYSYLFELDSPDFLFWASIKMHFYWFAMLALYWYSSIKEDKPMAQYVNSFAFGFSLFISLDFLHMFSLIYSFPILNEIGQYWNFVIIGFFAITLTLKLYSAATDYGKWYEQILVFGNTHFGRRRGTFDRIIIWLFFSEEKTK